MCSGKNHVCPSEHMGSFDNRFRRWIHNPEKILKPFIEKGMVVMDLGCGPGFFTIDMAQLVGRNGHVIAVDLQEEMLHRLEFKIRGTEFIELITLHQCQEDEIGVDTRLDFILAFYVIHEVPNQRRFFKDMRRILKRGGKILIVEPPFHVSYKDYKQSLQSAVEEGFIVHKGPFFLFSKSAVLELT